MDVEQLEFPYTAGEKWKIILALWKTVWQLKKLSIHLQTYGPAIQLLGIYPRRMKAYAKVLMIAAL